MSAAVQNAAGGIPSNPLMPIRAGMHIDVQGNRVAFTGSDGDITFTARLVPEGIMVFEPGQAVVPGKLLADVMKSLPDGDVTLRTDGPHLRVLYGRGFKSQFNIRVASDEYPASPEPANPAGTIPAEVFADAIRRTAFAAHRTSSEAALTAICLEAGDDLTVAATDKYRVAAMTCKWSPEGWDAPTALVPARAAERFIRGLDGDVEAGWDDRVCTLRSGEFDMTTRLIAGTFPDWKKILPEVEPDVRVPLEELTGAVKRAQLAADADSPVELIFQGGNLLVEAQGGSGRSSEVLEVGYDGAFSALFGAQYLLEGLNACSGECRMGFTGSLSPVHVYSGSDFRYTVLPRRKT